VQTANNKDNQNKIERTGWLRAAVLGADDGIVSTASLLLGVASAHGSRQNVLVAGIAGLFAGAMSMAAGEYVSVHSQADTEKAELRRERSEHKANMPGELDELADIYVERGVERQLARKVAGQLMAHDAIGAHARDELGITQQQKARPVQAAFASAASFALGAGVPLLISFLIPESRYLLVISGSCLILLALLGGMAAHAGGADILRGALRVMFWGALAMAVTAGAGALAGRSF
jgi:VIT1/CCC1 family predicted Fe2+/Mn2+ transporter